MPLNFQMGNEYFNTEPRIRNQEIRKVNQEISKNVHKLFGNYYSQIRDINPLQYL